MSFNQYNSGTTWEEAKVLRRSDVSTIDQLERNKLTGRVRLDRATPSSSSDIIQGDAEGDRIFTGAALWELQRISGTLQWVEIGAGGGGGAATDIGGLITAGTNVSISGAGTTASPYAISSSQTNITGNAGTATALQTSRNINGVAFDGTADITVPALISLSTVEKNLGNNPRRDGKFTITGLSGLTIGKPVNISQAVAPYTNKGTRADEAEMDGLIVKAVVTAVDTITAYWNSATRVKGNFKFNYFVGA